VRRSASAAKGFAGVTEVLSVDERVARAIADYRATQLR
jgi:hypothetical protein